MMKKRYEELLMAVLPFSTEDVICTSGDDGYSSDDSSCKIECSNQLVCSLQCLDQSLICTTQESCGPQSVCKNQKIS